MWIDSCGDFELGREDGNRESPHTSTLAYFVYPHERSLAGSRPPMNLANVLDEFIIVAATTKEGREEGSLKSDINIKLLF